MPEKTECVMSAQEALPIAVLDTFQGIQKNLLKTEN